MNATERIYKPSQRAKVIASPGHESTPNGAAVNGTGQSGAEVTTPFPVDCLPPTMANMAQAIALTERTPITLAACCVLGIVSASIGAGLQVKSGPDRKTRGNLFLLGSADSGGSKSETFRHAVKPLQEFERAAVEQWLTHTKPRLDTEKAMLEARLAQLKKEAGRAKDSIEREALRGDLEQVTADLLKTEAECHAPVLLVEDITTERLAVMLAHNDEQLASLSADAGANVNNLLGRYNKLDRTDEGIYLKSYSGDYCRVDRIGREPVVLQWPCITIVWLVQPDKVETLLAERSLTDGGLIPRLLVCHTRAQPMPIVDGIQGIPTATAKAWHKLVQDLIRAFRLAGEPFTIEPTPEAQQAMRDHYNRIVERRKTDLRDVGTFAARWTEQAWRIAVCLHAGLHGEQAGERGLDAGTARNAITIADWFSGEQLQILAGGRNAARQSLLESVLKLLAENPKGIRASDIYRARIVASADEAHALLERLETEGELVGKDSMPEKGGHITRIYTKARK